MPDGARAAKYVLLDVTGFSLLVLAWYVAVRAALAYRGRRPVLGALLRALPAHLAAIALTPFLSSDPTFYAALGRVMVTYHARPTKPLASVLPANDPFLLIQQYPFLRRSMSVYYGGFHAICAAVATFTSDIVTTVHAHQSLAAIAILATGAVIGQAARTSSSFAESSSCFTSTVLERVLARRSDFASSRNAEAGVAAALVVSSPCAIIEASLSAHNDAFMAFFLALAVWALLRKRPLLAAALALPALLIKMSGVIVIAFFVGGIFAVSLRAVLPPTRNRVLIGIGGGVVLALSALYFGAGEINRATSLFTKAFPHVTLRSPEAIPRILIYGLDELRPALGADRIHYGYWIGVGFRCLTGVTLVATLVAAYVTGRRLAWIAPGLLFFLTAGLGSTHPWYQLLLLPFLPFADGRWSRALVFGLIGMTFTSALDLYLALNCSWPVASVWIPAAVAQLVLANGIALYLWRRDKRSQELPRPRALLASLACCVAITILPTWFAFVPARVGPDVVLGTGRVRGVTETGFHAIEWDGTTPTRWTNGAASMTIPLRGRHPSELELKARDMNPKERSLVELRANGEVFFSGRMPVGEWSETFPLPEDNRPTLTIEIRSSTFRPAVTSHSSDKRTLGIQIKSVRLLDFK